MKKNIQTTNGITGGNMKRIVYKPPSGKLLRIWFNAEGGVIKNLRITGDFFIHPEKAIIDIERFLKNKHLKNINTELSSFIKKNKITLIGFAPKDLQVCLLANFDNCCGNKV